MKRSVLGSWKSSGHSYSGLSIRKGFAGDMVRLRELAEAARDMR